MALHTDVKRVSSLVGWRGRLATGALGILVVVIAGLISLFALHYAQQQQQEMTERLRQLQEASESATDAQVAFKLQVQEWKNSLLRGGDLQEYEHYRGAMQEQAARVQANLAALAEGTDDPALVEEVAEALVVHQDLLRSYQEAFARFEAEGRQDPVQVDASVRGIDRPLDLELDSLAERLRTTVDEMLDEAQQAAVERYEDLRLVVLVAHGLGALLLCLLLVIALRSGSTS